MIQTTDACRLAERAHEHVGVGRADQPRDRVLVLERQLVGPAAGHAVERDPGVEQDQARASRRRARSPACR